MMHVQTVALAISSPDKDVQFYVLVLELLVDDSSCFLLGSDLIGYAVKQQNHVVCIGIRSDEQAFLAYRERQTTEEHRNAQQGRKDAPEEFCHPLRSRSGYNRKVQLKRCENSAGDRFHSLVVEEYVPESTDTGHSRF
jgi:hypothetical protein